MISNEPDGATPLDPDEEADLIPGHISTRGELNEWEQINILSAQSWALGMIRNESALNFGFARELHHQMFDKTWKWAGKFRMTEKTIGVTPYRIAEELHNLIENAKSWVQHGEATKDEIGVRFHHQLVWIHPFPNGNGRHSRLLTDLLMIELGALEFTWGSGDLTRGGMVRDTYIKALRAADGGSYSELARFVRA